jgi:amidohydrolase
MDTIRQKIAGIKDRLTKIRRDLHQIPEPAYTETKTAAYLLNSLAAIGDLEVHPNIAQHGIMALLKTGRPGPTLLIRADMDALPIEEKTSLAFASRHPGAMHACGHDGHMAMLLGTAMVLAEHSAGLKGTVKFIFQPAEEGPGGAKPMIDQGVMENPTVDYAIGCHLWTDLPEGTIGVKAGPAMAAMDRFDIRIIGKGAHGAAPHLGVDALEVGTQVINALQRLVSRQINPIHPAVVTVGRFYAGTAFNVIPGEAQMSGTTRTFDRDIWDSWPAKFERIVGGVCASMGAEYEMTYTRGYPPLVNDPDITEIVRRCAADTVGASQVIEPPCSMGGEDMAYFLERAKGCFFFLGAGYPGAATIHNPGFNFHETILPTGVEAFCRIALALLGNQANIPGSG